MREAERERERKRERKSERVSERGREGERETERDSEREREREPERQTDRQREGSYCDSFKPDLDHCRKARADLDDLRLSTFDHHRNRSLHRTRVALPAQPSIPPLKFLSGPPVMSPLSQASQPVNARVWATAICHLQSLLAAHTGETAGRRQNAATGAAAISAGPCRPRNLQGADNCCRRSIKAATMTSRDQL